MLFSPWSRLALAHYPKTAGSSLTEWFLATLSDAHEVAPGDPHMPVRPALRKAGILRPRARTGPALFRDKVVREAVRLVTGRPAAVPEILAHSDVHIIGVIREPFEMLVSLYEYWRRIRFDVEPLQPLIRTARSGTFREFLTGVVDGHSLPDYARFFDVGGPLWANTRLLDFASLGPALVEVCDELGISPPQSLGTCNAAPKKIRDLGGYYEEAGPLAFRVRSHFGWYYDEGVRLMRRGDRADRQSPRRAA